MRKTNWITQKIFSDTAFLLKGVTSLTLYNAANSKVYLSEKGHWRKEITTSLTETARLPI